MKRSNKIAATVLATLGLGLAVVGAQANPGSMGGAMGPEMMSGMHGAMGPGMVGAMHGAMGPGMVGTMHGAMGPGMISGMHDAMGPGSMGSGMAGQQLMTPEERTAMREKMRAATTPEERQMLAEENHAAMQKRAAEKGLTLPNAHFPHHHFGLNAEPKKP